jgi:ABC-2 type transport system ATP-binding protein
VEAICDRVIIINKGQIVADDKLSNLQKASTDKHAVVVKFKEPIDKSLLEKFSYVFAVEEPQTSNFKLQTSNPELVRKQILELSLQHNLNIVSLQSENQSLEEVFRSLTQKS